MTKRLGRLPRELGRPSLKNRFHRELLHSCVKLNPVRSAAKVRRLSGLLKNDAKLSAPQATVATGILFLDQPARRQVFLKSQVPELVDWLKLAVDPFMPGLDQQAAAVFDSLNEILGTGASKL